MRRDRRIGSLATSRAIDEPDTDCQTHGIPFDENRRCSACREAARHLFQVVASRGYSGQRTRHTFYARCSCGWVGHEHTTHANAETEGWDERGPAGA